MAIQSKKDPYDFLRSLERHQQTAKLPSQPYAKVGVKDTSFANAGNRIWSALKTAGKTAVETVGIGIDTSITTSLTGITAAIGSLMSYFAYEAYQHGMKCSIFATARNIVLEKPSVLTKILWSDRAWSDYLPFVGAFEAESFSDLLSIKTSILPKAVQAFLNTGSGIREIKKFMNDKGIEPIITEYLEKTGKLSSLKGTTLFEKAVAYVDSISKDLAAAECKDFEGYANTTATLVTVLGSIIILTGCYVAAKKLAASAYKKCNG